MCQPPSFPLPLSPSFLPSSLSTHPKNTTSIQKFVQLFSVVFHRVVASSNMQCSVAEKNTFSYFITHCSSQFNPQISKTGPSLDTNGLTLTHKRVKIEANKIDQTNTMVGILSCLPSKPFRNG